MRRRTWLALGAVAVVVLLAVLISTYRQTDLFRSRPAGPLPSGQAIETSRQQVVHDVSRLFEDVDAACARDSIVCYDTATLDCCYKGQHDWKVDSRYENRCDYRMRNYYGFNGDFRTVMTDLDEALTAAGWTSGGGGLERILGDYYDRYAGPDRPKPANFPGQYLVSNMPAATYSNGSFLLTVAYAEADSQGVASRIDDHVRGPETSYREERTVDTKALYPTILATNRYIVWIEIRRESYFVN